jgi:nicotinamide mononucleotide (NMN) deamidase PncC
MGCLARIIAVLRERHVDVVHTHSAKAGAWAEWLLAGSGQSRWFTRCTASRFTRFSLR